MSLGTFTSGGSFPVAFSSSVTMSFWNESRIPQRYDLARNSVILGRLVSPHRDHSKRDEEVTIDDKNSSNEDRNVHTT